MTERSRYARQEAFAGIGREGQARLRSARVLLVGTGALGSALAETLVRGGVGRLTLIDRDVVETGNLQRQILFDEEDARLSLPKAVAAERRLRRLNAEVEVSGVVADVHGGNVAGFLRDCDLVLDGTDNLATRYLLNDACLQAGLPWVYAASAASHGLVLVVRPRQTPCLRCVLGGPPPAGLVPTCESEGILATTVLAVASIAGTEAFKLLAGREDALVPGLVRVDVWDGTLEVTDLGGHRPSCPACTLGQYGTVGTPDAELLCGGGVVQLRPQDGAKPHLGEIASRLEAQGELVQNDHLVRFRTGGLEMTVFGDGRTLVRGARDAAEARGFVARYIGS